MTTISTEKKKGNKLVTLVIESAILLLVVAILFMVRANIYEPAVVISRSMEPALQVGDRMIIDHRASLAGSWRRGDVVMFDAPPSWGEDESEPERPTQFVKRIIGMPGETIEVAFDGQVYINGSPALKEPYIAERALTVPARAVLGEGQYFMMGDNRANSDDSRRNGPIGEEDIHGRAVRVFWPLGRSGPLSSPSYN